MKNSPSAILLCLLLLAPASSLAQGKPDEAKTTFVPKPAGTVRRLPSKTTVGKTATAKATLRKGASMETGPTTVVVRATADVNGAHFTLGEIADFEGKDKALQTLLAKVEIGASPLPGLSRLVFPGDVTVHLRAARLGDRLDSRQIEVIAPPEMRVTRAGHDVGADEITSAAIIAAQPAIKDLTNASLEAVGVSGKVTLPAGKVRVVAGAYRGQPESGTLVVPVSLIVDGKPVQSVDVTLHVRRKLLVVVAGRTLEPHDVVNANDVSLVLVELPPGFAKPLTRVEDVVGKRATRRIMADAPLSALALETPPDIAANTRLTIEYVFGSIHIAAPGLARQAGMIGDTIRVYAVDTRKELEAVIVDAHTVQLQETE